MCRMKREKNKTGVNIEMIRIKKKIKKKHFSQRRREYFLENQVISSADMSLRTKNYQMSNELSYKN